MTLYLFDDLAITRKEIMTKEKILLKLGGSLITKKNSEIPKINIANLERIGELLDNNKYDLIVVHGAGSFGHPIAEKFNLINGLDESPEQKKSIKEIRNQMKELNQILCDIIESKGIKTKSIIPSESMKTRGAKHISQFPKEMFDKCMNEGKTPVTFGDATDDELQGINILSGDVIMMELARIYKPAFSIFIMDYPGVMDGELNSKNSHLIPLINSNMIDKFKQNERNNKTSDVTGGLIGKLECALEISQYSQCWITNLDSLNLALLGKPKGSKVVQ